MFAEKLQDGRTNMADPRDFPRKLDYIKKLPDEIPEGKILVHNSVRPQKTLGRNGFRAWLDELSLFVTPAYTKCDCGWAAELGDHYIVNRQGPFSTEN
jgi:hypothetical protein